ncbi:DNA-binding transcriptional MerR regulator [Roseiarcus fermentans]|uniref:DNA-binding transcriptional MerR regulator n=1 Tax=Roseiarcus fermentans TaxID=1473586 RepID=A0A366EJ57_9HYPH|nr:MerR family transcriptional regulator [Roseiarcus fermentans]RBP02457.1 DNA-binding transcriptional MerR regulator [Roseiarcus fermentans]
MRIGEIAAEAGVTRTRIRFYEERGLLPQAPRRKNGYRDYARSTIATLRLIEDAQALGFSLREIRAVMPSLGSPSITGTILDALERRLAYVKSEIETSRALQRKLVRLIGEQRACGAGADAAPPPQADRSPSRPLPLRARRP